jgi:hypothetical protein
MLKMIKKAKISCVRVPLSYIIIYFLLCYIGILKTREAVLHGFRTKI